MGSCRVNALCCTLTGPTQSFCTLLRTPILKQLYKRKSEEIQTKCPENENRYFEIDMSVYWDRNSECDWDEVLKMNYPRSSASVIKKYRNESLNLRKRKK